MFFHELASPFDSLTQMNILQDRLHRLVDNMHDGRKTEFPLINVWASEKNIVVVAEVPGIDPDEIDLQICNQTMTVATIKRALEAPEEGQAMHRRERGYGQFTRCVELPYAIDPEKVNASFANGMLRIEFTRASADIPKKIAVQAS